MCSRTKKISINSLNIKEIVQRLLFEYRSLKKIFNQIKIKKLSSHRFYNHKIELNENRSQLFKNRVYSISIINFKN